MTITVTEDLLKMLPEETRKLFKNGRYVGPDKNAPGFLNLEPKVDAIGTVINPGDPGYVAPKAEKNRPMYESLLATELVRNITSDVKDGLKLLGADENTVFTYDAFYSIITLALEAYAKRMLNQLNG